MSGPITALDTSRQAIVIITVAPVARRAGCFAARLGQRLLVAASRQPFLDSARVLVADGVNPDTTIAMRHRGADHDALRARLGTAAALRVEDHPAGVRFAGYRENGPANARGSTAHARATLGRPDIARAYIGATPRSAP
jgi:hypothetical protein